ncbi:MAG: DPP IV N-terminal domain-containing protein, partial [Planctomycetota bacterium]|nr:DPP IV N-terminal domain-containing protein [Planctomycetota bacterium]
MDCRSKSYREEAYVEALEPRLLLAGSTGPVTHFDWDTISSPQTVDVPFTTTITAKDANDYTVTDFTGPVNLTGLTGPGTVTIGAGTSTWDYPLQTYFGVARTQVIYQASEVGGAGPITSLALNVTTAPGKVFNHWTIRMKHTALSAYSTNAWEDSGWTTVYQSTQTISATGWTTFVFSTPFAYNGTSNLMVDFSFNTSAYVVSNGTVQATHTSQNRSLYCEDTGCGDPLTWSGTSFPTPFASTYIPNIRLNVGASVAIAPTTSGSFVNGVWTGQVTVNQKATGMYLKAADGRSHVGTSNTFKVAAPPSEIHGSEWCDLDGDGVWDVGEPPLAGWTVYLDSNGNGRWNAGEPTQVTDANGHYAFTNLPAGTYTVGEVIQSGWTQTHAGPTQPGLAKIAFTSDRDGYSDIYVMNADGTGQTRLTNSGVRGFAPAFSPDGRKIAFDSAGLIYVMNADGTGQTRLTNGAGDEIRPAFSPDGTKIAFDSDRDGNCEIYVMNADGTGQTRLTNNAAVDLAPTFSPDGRKIAFASDRDGNYEIYVMNADGTAQTRLTNNAASDYDPTFSPDGSKIAFVSSRDGNFEIYVMNADG